MAAQHVAITILSIFLMMIPAIILKKKKIVGDSAPSVVAGLITEVTFPCMIITNMQLEYSARIVNNCKYILLVFAMLIVVSMGISRLAVKLLNLSKQREGILAFMFMFGNSGFLGVPLLSALFGPEAVFYGALCDATYNVFMFSVGMNMIKAGTASEGGKISMCRLVRCLINPCFLSVLIGLALFFSGITIPAFLASPMNMLGSATTPLAMMLIGLRLADVSVKELIIDKTVYLPVFFKLLVAPCVALGIVSLFPNMELLLKLAIVVESSMPAAMATVIFSEQYKSDVMYATKGVAMSTILSMLTIPLFVILVGIL